MGVPPDLQDRIARIFAGPLRLDIASPDTDLFESGVLDSLAFVELLLQLEREFGVTTSVDDLELDNFRTMSRIAEFISTRGEHAGRSTARVIELNAHR